MKPFDQLHVLVVDDNAVNRRFLDGTLKPQVARLESADGGRQALELGLAAEWDIVILDLHMPDLDGETVMQRLREMLPAKRVPLIVALTADARDSERDRLLETGFDGYLTKPLSGKSLLDGLKAIRSNPGDAGAWHWRSEAGTAVFDDHDALTAVNGDRDLLDDMRRQLRGELPEHLAAIDASLSEHDWSTAAEAAHQLAGACGFCGAAALQQACRGLEAAMATPDASGIAAGYTAFRRELTRLQAALE